MSSIRNAESLSHPAARVRSKPCILRQSSNPPLWMDPQMKEPCNRSRWKALFCTASAFCHVSTSIFFSSCASPFLNLLVNKSSLHITFWYGINYLYVSDPNIFIFKLDFSTMNPGIWVHGTSPPQDPTSTWLLKAELLPHTHLNLLFFSIFIPKYILELSLVSTPFCKLLFHEKLPSPSLKCHSNLLASLYLHCWCFPGSPCLLSSRTDPAEVSLIFSYPVTSFSKSFLTFPI